MKRRTGLVSTHAFARSLLSRSDEYVRFWLFGKLSIVWDTSKPVPPTIPYENLFRSKP